MEILCNQVPRDRNNKRRLHKNKHQAVLSASITLVLLIELRQRIGLSNIVLLTQPKDLNKLLKELQDTGVL